MSEQIRALLETNHISVTAVEQVTNTPWYKVWLKEKFSRKAVAFALRGSTFECVGGGHYHGKALAIVAVRMD